MKRSVLWGFFAVAFGLLSGCEGTQGEELLPEAQDIATSDAPSALDVTQDVSVPLDASPPDIQVEDLAAAPDECEQGQGCFGEPCQTGGDCLSGICTLHLGERVCSKTCDETCPTGWDCALVGRGSDGQYACISQFSHLCLPCASAGDCNGDVPNACVQYAEGTSFCGGALSLIHI